MLNQNSLRAIEAQIVQNLRTTSLGQNLLVLTKKNRLFGETSHCFQTNCSWSVVCPNVILTGEGL